MLTPPNAYYLDLLRHAHESHVRVMLYDKGVEVGELSVASITLSLDGRGEIWRTAQIGVGVDYWQSDEREWLEQANVQYGEVTIEHGIKFLPSQLEPDWVQLARLRIDQMSITTLVATRSFTAFDRALLLGENHLQGPYPLGENNGDPGPPHNTYAQDIAFLVEESTGDTVTIDPTLPTKSARTGSVLQPGTNRLSEIHNMADALGAVFYNDQYGAFRLDSANPVVSSVWDINDGPEGVLVGLTQDFARGEQYNAVGMEFSPEPDTADWQPLYRYAYDDDPASPTYYFGPFGKRSIFFSEEYDHVVSVEEADDLAARKLAEYLGVTHGVAFTAVYNPLLQPGDHVMVTLPETGITEEHIIESIDLPLAGGAMMSVQTRLKRDPMVFASGATLPQSPDTRVSNKKDGAAA